MSCTLNKLTANECGVSNVRGLNLVWAIPTHDIESVVRVIENGKVTGFSSINLKTDKHFKDVTAKKTMAKHSFSEEGDDPQDRTFNNVMDLATAYLNKAKRLAVQSFQNVEVTFLYRDNNDQIVLVGDEKRGLYRSALEGGTGSQTDGRNGADMTFTGQSMQNIGLHYDQAEITALLPLLEPEPTPPVTP